MTDQKQNSARRVRAPQLSRRTLLRGAGGVAIALPFLEAMEKPARAQSESVRRLIFEFKPNGDQTARRFDQSGETDFVLGEFLAPLEPYRENLFFANRLNKRFDMLPSSERADQHQQGGASLAPWASGAGDFPVGGEERTIGYVLGPSADHAIGDRVLQENPNIPYRHLVYRVGDRHNDIWNLSAHAGPPGSKNPVLPETDPFAAYARIFGFLNSEESDAVLLHNLEMRRSVLDLARGRVQDLSQKLGAADKQRLELHAEAIRDLERTLAGGVFSAQCQATDLGDSFDPYLHERHLASAGVFFKIIALSFACDLTRVVNFNWAGNTSQRVYANLGLSEGHHDISHKSDADSFTQIRMIHRHLWESTTSLYEELMATPDGEGSLWDSTAVVHWNELGQGDVHSTHDALCIIAGGADGFFQKNRLVDYGSAAAFSDMLVACFHYMGFDDVTVFGDERLSGGQGPLSGLIA
jgi:hypothetical protein